jgi:hypothetical protein
MIRTLAAIGLAARRDRAARAKLAWPMTGRT